MYETFYEPTEQDLRDYAAIKEEQEEEYTEGEGIGRDSFGDPVLLDEEEDWPMPPLPTPGRNDSASLDCPY